MSIEKKKSRIYPHSIIDILPGDVLYSSIGKSTYYVGHSVIIGTDYMIKEVLPGIPAWHTMTIEQFWHRHHVGDRITLLRAIEGANEAAIWITENLHRFQTYHLANYDMSNIGKSYCYKFIAQVFQYGANLDIVRNSNRILLPHDIKKSPKLQKVALFIVG